MSVKILHGNCLELLPTLEANSVHSVVTDPPYELGFMNKKWDRSGIAYNVDLWREVSRVIKPGGHLLAFGGTRTYHRLACSVEDAGFELRDCLMWVFGSGFPKSLDVSKALDAMAGTQRKPSGINPQRPSPRAMQPNGNGFRECDAFIRYDNPVTDAARQWAGFGTALKPAYEPIILARKPLTERNVAANVLVHGCGALNVDGCRICAKQNDYNHPGNTKEYSDTSRIYGWAKSQGKFKRSPPNHIGRWPANLIHDGSPDVMVLFPITESGVLKAGTLRKSSSTENYGGLFNGLHDETTTSDTYGNTESAARFFYCAKASTAERDGSKHPTVKPLSLMRWLVRLVTPPGGTVLDPFAGSGTTGEAAIKEGFNAVLIERESEYLADIERRIDRANLPLFEEVVR